MKNNKTQISSIVIAFLFIFLAFASGESKTSTSNCDGNNEDYIAGYEHGKINRDGGSTVCGPFKGNKVHGHEGYVNTGEIIRPVRSDCFCKGFEDGLVSK